MHSLQAVMARRADKMMSAELRPVFLHLLMFSFWAFSWVELSLCYLFLSQMYSEGVEGVMRGSSILDPGAFEKVKSVGLGYGCVCCMTTLGFLGFLAMSIWRSPVYVNRKARI